MMVDGGSAPCPVMAVVLTVFPLLLEIFVYFSRPECFWCWKFLEIKFSILEVFEFNCV